MSTKVYEGYKLDTTDINVLFEKTEKIRRKIKIVAVDQFAKLIVRKFTQFYDNDYDLESVLKEMVLMVETDKRIDFELKWKRENGLSEPLYRIITDLADARHRKSYYSETRDVDCDFHLILNVFGYKDKIVLYPFYEQKKYSTVLQEEFEEYGYFNNSDKPEKISDKDWDERSDAWNYVLDNQEPLQYNAYKSYESVINFFSEDEVKDFKNKLISHIPSDDERAKDLATVSLYNKKKMNSKKPSEYMSFIQKLKTDFKEEFEQEIIKIKKQLKSITLDVIENYTLKK